jgi:hypothetical protein
MVTYFAQFFSEINDFTPKKEIAEWAAQQRHHRPASKATKNGS